VTRLPCWLCHGNGYYEDGPCDVVACEGGVIHFPLTREAVMDDIRNGQSLGEHYGCVAEYVDVNGHSSWVTRATGCLEWCVLYDGYEPVEKRASLEMEQERQGQ
jgi:hypothetical protein